MTDTPDAAYELAQWCWGALQKDDLSTEMIAAEIRALCEKEYLAGLQHALDDSWDALEVLKAAREEKP